MTEHALLTELKEPATAIEECPAETADALDPATQRLEQTKGHELIPLSIEGKPTAANEQANAETSPGNSLQMNSQENAAAGDGALRPDFSLQGAVEKAERQAIGFALARCNNNRAHAARLLRISRALLYKRMHRYHLL